MIAVLRKRRHICSAARLFVHNVVLDGTGCSGSDVVGAADLDGRGRPRRDSPTIDGALRHYAPSRDAEGDRRVGRPDIRAFEYR